jgi:hypothetical protein
MRVLMERVLSRRDILKAYIVLAVVVPHET